MATAKKGLIAEAMASKPVKATKGIINKAMDAVADAFTDPPRKPAKRAAAKKIVARKAPARKTMDRQLVSTMEGYEVAYLAQKHKVTQKAVKAAVAKVGHSRSKVEAELKKGK